VLLILNSAKPERYPPGSFAPSARRKPARWWRSQRSARSIVEIWASSGSFISWSKPWRSLRHRPLSFARHGSWRILLPILRRRAKLDSFAASCSRWTPRARWSRLATSDARSHKPSTSIGQGVGSSRSVGRRPIAPWTLPMRSQRPPVAKFAPSPSHERPGQRSSPPKAAAHLGRGSR
jgi:hypothetical protein